ncbi:glutathione transferase [Trifolium repens]|nr:glutathione transferase [Trifolium repens]
MGNQDVKFVSFWASPNAKRVEWALKIKGVDYEYVEEDIFNKSSLLLELNPTPLLPHHPYQRALARFWANFAEQKLMEAAWVATCSRGEEQEKALKLARDAIEKIEDEIKGKKFFGGDNIGYLDLALGWISYWLPIWEEVGSMQVLDPLRCPAISSWKNNFLSNPVIKDSLPPRDEMNVYFHSRRKTLLEDVYFNSRRKALLEAFHG